MLCDEHGLDDSEVMSFWYRFMAEVNSSKLYNFLFQLLTPAMMIRGVSGIWANFHRGTTLTAEQTKDGRQWVWAFPAGLIDPLTQRGYSFIFQQIMDGARAVGRASVSLASSSATEARYRIEFHDGKDRAP